MSITIIPAILSISMAVVLMLEVIAGASRGNQAALPVLLAHRLRVVP